MLSSVLAQAGSGRSPRPGLPAACGWVSVCPSRAERVRNWGRGLAQSLWLAELGLVSGSKRHLPAGPENWVTVVAEGFLDEGSPPCSVSAVSRLGHSATTATAAIQCSCRPRLGHRVVRLSLGSGAP